MIRNYDLKPKDFKKYSARFIITDKRLSIELFNTKKSVDLDVIEFPNSKYYDSNIFPSKLVQWVNEFDDNSIKAIRNRGTEKVLFFHYLKNYKKKFIIDFLPMYKRTLSKQKQAQFRFEKFKDFEEQLYYLLRDVLCLTI